MKPFRKLAKKVKLTELDKFLIRLSGNDSPSFLAAFLNNNKGKTF